MRYVYLLILVTHTKGKSHLIFDNQLTFLQSSYRSPDILKLRTTHTIQVFNHLVIDSLLLHNKL